MCTRAASLGARSISTRARRSRRRFCYEIGEVLDWARGFPQPAAVAYEAGPTGFGLARAFASSGIECVVAAPSKLQRPAGDRVKTDSRDALHLARLLRLGEIVPVRIPSIEQETARDLVRSRDDNRGNLMAAGNGDRGHGVIPRGGIFDK